LKIKAISFLLFFGILFTSCNDCTDPGDSQDEDLIYFSAKDNSSGDFSGFLLDPQSLFIENLFQDGKILGFSDSRILFSRESNSLTSLYLYDEAQKTEQLIYEEIDGIDILFPTSNLDTDVISFYGDETTIYQTDLTGNLIVLSRDAISNYHPQMNSIGYLGLFEKIFDEIFLRIVDKSGSFDQSIKIEEDITEEENKISWNNEGTNLIYSLKSSDGSTVYRTRIDGFTQKLFEISGHRVTKPFFADEELIGYYNNSLDRIEIIDIRTEDVTIIFSTSSAENIIGLNWSHNRQRLYLELNYIQSAETDIYYFDIGIQNGDIVSIEKNLLVNDGLKAYSK
jgi:hypothetical protein